MISPRRLCTRNAVSGSVDAVIEWLDLEIAGTGFQYYAFWPHLTASQNIALPLAEVAELTAKSEDAN